MPELRPSSSRRRPARYAEPGEIVDTRPAFLHERVPFNPDLAPFCAFPSLPLDYPGSPPSRYLLGQHQARQAARAQKAQEEEGDGAESDDEPLDLGGRQLLIQCGKAGLPAALPTTNEVASEHFLDQLAFKNKAHHADAHRELANVLAEASKKHAAIAAGLNTPGASVPSFPHAVAHQNEVAVGIHQSVPHSGPHHGPSEIQHENAALLEENMTLRRQNELLRQSIVNNELDSFNKDKNRAMDYLVELDWRPDSDDEANKGPELVQGSDMKAALKNSRTEVRKLRHIRCQIARHKGGVKRNHTNLLSIQAPKPVPDWAQLSDAAHIVIMKCLTANMTLRECSQALRLLPYEMTAFISMYQCEKLKADQYEAAVKQAATVQTMRDLAGHIRAHGDLDWITSIPRPDLVTDSITREEIEPAIAFINLMGLDTFADEIRDCIGTSLSGELPDIQIRVEDVEYPIGPFASSSHEDEFSCEMKEIFQVWPAEETKDTDTVEPQNAFPPPASHSGQFVAAPAKVWQSPNKLPLSEDAEGSGEASDEKHRAEDSDEVSGDDTGEDSDENSGESASPIRGEETGDEDEPEEQEEDSKDNLDTGDWANTAENNPEDPDPLEIFGMRRDANGRFVEMSIDEVTEAFDSGRYSCWSHVGAEHDARVRAEQAGQSTSADRQQANGAQDLVMTEAPQSTQKAQLPAKDRVPGSVAPPEEQPPHEDSDEEYTPGAEKRAKQKAANKRKYRKRKRQGTTKTQASSTTDDQATSATNDAVAAGTNSGAQPLRAVGQASWYDGPPLIIDGHFYYPNQIGFMYPNRQLPANIQAATLPPENTHVPQDLLFTLPNQMAWRPVGDGTYEAVQRQPTVARLDQGGDGLSATLAGPVVPPVTEAPGLAGVSQFHNVAPTAGSPAVAGQAPNSLQLAMADEHSDDTPTEPIKRGRGRPRKYPPGTKRTWPRRKSEDDAAARTQPQAPAGASTKLTPMAVLTVPGIAVAAGNGYAVVSTEAVTQPGGINQGHVDQDGNDTIVVGGPVASQKTQEPQAPVSAGTTGASSSRSDNAPEQTQAPTSAESAGKKDEDVDNGETN